MPEQDTQTPEATEDTAKDVKSEPEWQDNEKETSKTHFQEDPPNDQGTITGGPANTSAIEDPPGASADKTDDAPPAGDTKESDPADGSDEKKPVEASDETAPDGDGKAQSPVQDGSIDNSDKPESDEEIVLDVRVGIDDEPASDHADTDAPSPAQSPSVPEVTIGVSNVEPLPDQTLSQSPAVERIQNSAPLADVEIVDDEQVENQDLVEKPTVDGASAPTGLPELSDDGASSGKGDSPDGTGIESGDGDVSDPSRTAPDGAPGPGQTKLSEPDSQAKSDDDPANAPPDKLDAEKTGADEDTGEAATEAAQPAGVPTVEPAVSAAVELPEQNDAPTAETGPAAGSDLASDSAAPDQDPAIIDQGLDVMDLPKSFDPVAAVEFGDDDPAGAGPDPNAAIPGDDGDTSPGSDARNSEFAPGSKTESDGGNSPLLGPDTGATTAELERDSALNPGVIDDGPAPVSDSSGIEMSSDSGTYPGGSQWWTFEWGDGSKQKVTQYPDGGTTNETIVENPGGSTTYTHAEYDEDGKLVEKTKTTQHKDGSSVKETTKADGTVVEEHSDGTTIIYHPDGRTELIKPEDKDDDEQSGQQEQEEEQQEQQEEQEEPEETDTTDNSNENDANNNSTTRPDDDGLVDEDRLAAMHQAEADWQQSIRESSLINPGRTDAGSAEGGGEPPPGVDDPPEDESPRPDELPEADPVSIGLNEGTIDFGPDHVEEPHGGDSDPAATEAIGGQTDPPETQGADPDDTLTFDPAAMIESTEDLLDATSGLSLDPDLGFMSWGKGFESDTEEEPAPFDDGDDLF